MQEKYITEQTCTRVHESLGYEIHDMKENIAGVSVKLWAVMLGIVAILGGMVVNFIRG